MNVLVLLEEDSVAHLCVKPLNLTNINLIAYSLLLCLVFVIEFDAVYLDSLSLLTVLFCRIHRHKSIADVAGSW